MKRPYPNWRELSPQLIFHINLEAGADAKRIAFKSQHRLNYLAARFGKGAGAASNRPQERPVEVHILITGRRQRDIAKRLAKAEQLLSDHNRPGKRVRAVGAVAAPAGLFTHDQVGELIVPA